LLSDAFFYYSRHLELGKIDPASIKILIGNHIQNKKVDFGRLLTEGYKPVYSRQLEKPLSRLAMTKKKRSTEALEATKVDR